MKGKYSSILCKAVSVLLAGCLSISVMNAQNRSISGKVVDQANYPIVGASVVVVGNNSIGTVTDIDGAFKLSVPSGSNLNVSCIGYESQIVTPGDRTELTIVLVEDSEFLEETVVIGYGVQKKSDLTGSIASVKDSDFANRSG